VAGIRTEVSHVDIIVNGGKWALLRHALLDLFQREKPHMQSFIAQT